MADSSTPKLKPKSKPTDILDISLDDIERELSRRRNNKLGTWFPDKGPLRRELYVKHLEFFRAGSVHMERLFMAGNRCISPWTPIDLASGSSTRLTSELLSAPTFDVQSWGDGSRCNKSAGGLFLKSTDLMFRILLDNGSFFDATRKHRILTHDGYLSIGQLIHASDGLHCWRTSPDSQASCALDDRRDDERLRPSSSTDSEQPPSQADAQRRIRYGQPSGALEPIPAHIHAYPDSFHLSNPCDPNQIADLCGHFSDPSSSIDGQWPKTLRQELRQSGREYVLRRPDSVSFHHRTSVGPLSRNEYLFVDRKGLRSSIRSSESTLSLSPFYQSLLVEEFLRVGPLEQIFFPLSHPPLIGGCRIESIIPIGLQPVIDFTVEDTHNYLSGGVYHANTGKSIAGAYETCLHLTGLYPPWWEGRKFVTPTYVWACNKSATDCRDINQKELMGDNPAVFGTGMIPKDKLIYTKPKPSVPDAIEIAYIRHVSGGQSICWFRSYDQGREKFAGRAIHAIWADEEIPADVYGECLLRLMTTNGIIYLTYTPIQGLTPVTVDFLTNSVNRESLPIKFTPKDIPLDTRRELERIR